jgi:ribosomal protein S18 acetylase RimI-like enzyme
MILKNFDKNLIMQALEDNMSGKFAYLPSLSPDMTVNEKEITLINSYQSIDMFNILCKAKTNQIIQLQQAIEIFTQKNLPFAWWTGFLNEPNELCDQLEKLNFHRTENELGMAIKLSELQSKNKFPGLDIKNVNNANLLNDFIRVLTELLPNDKQAIENFYFNTQKFILNTDSLLKLYVGYLNNQPVATSALFSHAGVAGIWDIVTLPEARRKGIGTDMTLYALNEGKQMFAWNSGHYIQKQQPELVVSAIYTVIQSAHLQ